MSIASTGICRLSNNSSVYLGHCTLRNTLCRKCLVGWTASGCARSTLCRFFMSCMVYMVGLYILYRAFAIFASFHRDIPVRQARFHRKGRGWGFGQGRGRGGMNRFTCRTRLIRHFNVIVYTVVRVFRVRSEHLAPSSSNGDIPSCLTRPRFAFRRSPFITLNQLGNMSFTTRLSQTSFAGYWIEILALGFSA